MMDVTISISAAISIVSAVATLGGAWALIRYKGDENARKIAAAEARIEAAEDELKAFRIEAAREFATNDTVAHVEKRIVDAINRLGDRLDRVLEARPVRQRG